MFNFFIDFVTFLFFSRKRLEHFKAKEKIHETAQNHQAGNQS
jgi:hypothetical protein